MDNGGKKDETVFSSEKTLESTKVNPSTPTADKSLMQDSFSKSYGYVEHPAEGAPHPLHPFLLLFVLLITLAGIISGIYLIKSGNRTIPSKTQISSKIPFPSPVTPTPTEDPKAELTTITNSGSTNSLPWQLMLRNDASGTFELNGSPSRDILASETVVSSLSATLSKIGDIEKVVALTPCSKSASFGTITTISYKGKVSNDISCISPQDPQVYQDLWSEVSAITDEVVK